MSQRFPPPNVIPYFCGAIQHMKIILLFVFFCFSLQAQLQPFWKETTQFPTLNNGTGNLCSTADVNNNYLYVGTFTQGIFRSSDKGASWQQVLACTDTAIVKILIGSDHIYAIGKNIVFISQDGLSWKREAPGTDHLISDIEILPSGRILVSTAEIKEISPATEDFTGDGVFFSDDKGNSWVNSTAGIGYREAVNHIAVLSSGAIVGAMNSFDGWGGGIIFSNDGGVNWARLNNPRWRVTDTLNITKMYQVFCLEAGPDDSIYFSFEGVSENFGISGGVQTTFNHLVSSQPLAPYRVGSLGFPWQYQPFHSLFFAGNGNHRYSSLHTPNSTSQGGPYFQAQPAGGWQRVPGGILPVDNGYLKVDYTQDAEGRVYAIHHSDHRVYYSDASYTGPVGFRENTPRADISVFPNPTNDEVTIQAPESETFYLTLYDASAQAVYRNTFQMQKTMKLDLTPFPAGMYVLEISSHSFRSRQKLVVRR